MTPELSTTIAMLPPVFRAEADIDVAVIYGSVARGRARPASDLDVYVRLRPGMQWTLDQERELARAVSRSSAREAHLVVERPGHTSVLLRREVARHGVVVWEGRPDAWTRCKAAASLASVDLAYSLELCSEGVRRRVLREASGG